MSVKKNDQDKQIDKLLAENGITFTCITIEELASNAENSWLRDIYSARFTKNGHTVAFEYSCGIGHRVNKLPIKSENNKELRLASKLCNDKSLFRKNQPAWNQKQWLVVPTAASVLDCLLLDAQCGGETFNDFCADCGYDTDSRKALEIYLACQATNDKLRFLNGSLRSQIEEILQDY